MQSFLRDRFVSAVLVAMVSSACYFGGILGVNSARAQTATSDSVIIDATIDNVALSEISRTKAKITIVLDRRASQDETFAINYPTSATATAQHDVDFTGPTTVTIRKRKRKATFTIRAIDDNKVEDDEVGEILISGRSDPIRFTIVSDDVPPPPPTEILMSIRPYTLKEGHASRSRGRVLVVINQRAPEGGFPINIAYDNSSGLPNAAAKLGEDFTGPPSVTVPAGKFSTEFYITTIDDTVHESGSFGLEFSRVVASATAGGRTISASVGFNIDDNDKKNKDNKQTAADAEGQTEPKDETQQVADGGNADTGQTVENSGAVLAQKQEPSKVLAAETDEVSSTSGPKVAESKSEEQQDGSGICDRTPQVQTAILAALGETECAQVTAEDLESFRPTIITRLVVTDLTSLSPGDFADLSNLENLLLSGSLTAIPVGTFDGLSSLRALNLANNDFSTLSGGAFSNLDTLISIRLDGNKLNTLPPGIFNGLNNLLSINLQNNQISTLPPNLFSGLGAVQQIALAGNPGAPFKFTANLERAGNEPLVKGEAARLRARIAGGVSLPVRGNMNWQASGDVRGTASGSTTIPAGNSVGGSFDVVGNNDAAGAATVTVALDNLEFAAGTFPGSTTPFINSGVELDPGEPLTLTFAPPAAPTINSVTASQDRIAEASGSSESARRDGASVVEIKLSGEAPPGGLPVKVSAAGSATRGQDYLIEIVTDAGVETLPAGAVFTIPAGATSGILNISPLEDDVVDPDEDVILTVTDPATSEPKTVTLTIVDNDEAPSLPTVSVFRGQTPVSEGGVAQFIVSRFNTQDLNEPLPVRIALSGAESFLDAGTSLAGVVTIEANDPSATVSIRTDDDQTDEEDADLKFTILADAAYVVDTKFGSDTVTITDDDAPAAPVVAEVTASPETISEDGEESIITVRLNQAPVAADGLTVSLGFAGTADRGSDGDYTVSATSITIAQGQTTGTVKLTSRDDTIVEAAETIVVSVTGRDDLDPITITITDNDVPAVASISASPETIAEDDGETTVTVTLNQAPEAADGLTVPVTFSGSARLTKDYDARSDGFAVANGNEVVLAFAPGVDRQTITITAIADREKEDDETIVVTVGDRSATIALTNVFKESVLADVRRAGSFAMLRRSSDRFSRLTGDIVSSRLRGGRFSNVNENSGFRTTVREFAGGLRGTRSPDGPNKLGLKGGADPAGKGGWDVWVSVNGAKLSGVAEGSVFDIYAGVDTIVAPGILIGVLASYEAGDLETSGTGDLPGEGAYTGGFDSKGYSVGAYAGLRLLDDLTLDLAGSYGRLSPEISAVFRDDGNKDEAITGAYEARRMLLSGHLTGRAVFGNLLLSPQVGLIYARENQDGFTDSTNAEALAATLEFARIEFGTTLAYDFDLKPEHGAMGVTLTATGRSDFIRPDDVANQYSLAVRLGLEWVNTAGLSFRLEGGTDGIGLDDYESYDANATVTVPF